MEKLDTQVLREAFSVARYVWLRRNGFVFCSGFIAPKQLVAQAREALISFGEENTIADGANSGSMPIVLKWLMPSPGWVKLNCDAALSPAAKTMGIGVVARNDRGDVLATLAASVPCVSDPMSTEVLAAWREVQFGKERGYHRLMLESDLLTTVNVLNQEAPCLSICGQLVEDIRARLKYFSCCNVQHVSRTANTTAHSLAKYALFLSFDAVWMEECLPPIHHIVITNLSSD